MQLLKENLVYILLVLAVFLLGLYLSVPQIGSLYTKIITSINKTKENTTVQQELQQARQDAEARKLKPDASQKDIYVIEGYSVGPEASFAPLFETVLQKAKYNNVRLKSIDYKYSPAEDPIAQAKLEGYNVVELEMYMVASYEQFQGFIKDLIRENYLVNLSGIQVAPYEQNKKILLIKFNLRLYTKNPSASLPSANTGSKPGIQQPGGQTSGSLAPQIGGSNPNSPVAPAP